MSTLADRESLRLLILDAGRESWGVAVVLTSIPVSLILLLLLSLLWNDGIICLLSSVCTERRADRINKELVYARAAINRSQFPVERLRNNVGQ